MTSTTKKYAPTAYFIICALEGIWVLVSFWNDPTSKITQSALGGPTFRLGLILFITFMTTLFFVLAILEWKANSGKNSPISRLLDHRYILLFTFVLFTTGLIIAYIFMLSPIRLGRLLDYYQRWQPLFIWGILVILQLFGLTLLMRGATYWVEAGSDFRRDPRLQKIRSTLGSPASGYALLGISILFGLTKIYFGRFVDEADTITTGWLITERYTLYRDVFSHHFPFPYYWVAMVVSLFGNSFVAVRISVLLLQIGLFAFSMRITKFFLAIGLTSLVWNLINQFHRGQEAIYATFEGILMSVVFILIFWLLVKRPAVGKWIPALIGLLLALAILTDPLMIYPAVIAVVALFVSGILSQSESPLREGARRILLAGMMLALVGGVFVLNLTISGTLQDFYRSTIWFNAEIYAKYVDANPNRLDQILPNMVSGLKILDERWVMQVSPFVPLNVYRSVKLEEEHLYFSWIFASFLFRLSILSCVIGSMLNRRAAAGIFLHLYSASLLVREDDGLYTIGFTLVSLLAAFYLLTELQRPAFLWETKSRQTNWHQAAWKIGRVAWVTLLFLIGVMQFWSAIRGAYFLLDHHKAILNPSHVTMYNRFGKNIRKLACDSENLKLAVYPINPIVHFVSGIPPVSKYVWMYPWVAEIGQQELIAELKGNPTAVVWINVERGSDSPDGVAAYMADTLNFLDREYFVLGDSFWMSPELAESCSFNPEEIPFLQDSGGE